MIVPIIAVGIEKWMTQGIAKDVFRAAFGYGFPDDFKEAIERIASYGVLCTKHIMSVRIRDLDANHVIRFALAAGIWRHSVSRLEVRFNYFDRGPHRSEGGPDVLYREPGDQEQFTFRWTVADYIRAVLDAGCELVHVEEFGDTCADWEGVPMTGLPETLLLVGRRR